MKFPTIWFCRMMEFSMVMTPFERTAVLPMNCPLFATIVELRMNTGPALVSTPPALLAAISESMTVTEPVSE